MTRRWICEVPSSECVSGQLTFFPRRKESNIQSSKILESLDSQHDISAGAHRKSFSMGISVLKPMPPKTNVSSRYAVPWLTLHAVAGVLDRGPASVKLGHGRVVACVNQSRKSRPTVALAGILDPGRLPHESARRLSVDSHVSEHEGHTLVVDDSLAHGL